MSNTLYTITGELHEVIQAKAEKYGVEITHLATQSYYLILENGHTPSWNYATDYKSDFKERYGHLKGCFKLEDQNIRAILLAFKDVLGENPLYTQEKNKWLKEQKQYRGKIAYNSVCITFRELDYLLEGYGEPFYRLKKSQAETLCSKWLDGLEPMFNRELETVLSELLEVLKAL